MYSPQRMLENDTSSGITLRNVHHVAVAVNFPCSSTLGHIHFLCPALCLGRMASSVALDCQLFMIWFSQWDSSKRSESEKREETLLLLCSLGAMCLANCYNFYQMAPSPRFHLSLGWNSILSLPLKSNVNLKYVVV